MTRTTSNVLIDQIARDRTGSRDLLWIVGFSLLTAGLAQARIPLPYTPVPLTGQTFAVLLAGAVLGARRGFASQATYLALGAMGLPVFAGGIGGFPHLLGPTGGYLWSFPIAAGLLGWLTERGAGRAVWKLVLALCASDLLILSCGATWLGILFRESASVALHWGFYPFIVSNLIKIAAVGLTLPAILKRFEQRKL